MGTIEFAGLAMMLKDYYDVDMLWCNNPFGMLRTYNQACNCYKDEFLPDGLLESIQHKIGKKYINDKLHTSLRIQVSKDLNEEEQLNDINSLIIYKPDDD